MTRFDNPLAQSCRLKISKAASSLLALTVLACGSQSLRGEATFPYVAYVAAPQTFARSGPGQRYYPTQQLAQGFAVEVYRHDDEGWCAVRPPEGSFCWIAAHEARRIDGDQAEISVEGSVARVGSVVSPERSAVQVLLRRNERVQLLPSAANDDPNWLRITPPAGEFRWIAANNLARRPPVENSTGIQLAAGWTQQGARRDSPAKQVPGIAADRGFTHLAKNSGPLQPSFPQATPPANSGPILAGLPVPENESSAVELVATSPAAAELGGPRTLEVPPLLDNSTPLPGNPAVVSTSPRVRFGSSPSIVGPASARVEEMQLRLSQSVVRPKEEWQFDQLQAEATALLEKSDSASEREHLRDLLDRIARFQNLKQGQPTAPTNPAAITPGGAEGQFTGLTSQVRDLAQNDLAGSDPFEAKSAGIDAPRYDAVGRLKPVRSKDKDSPQYALVDDRGTVLSFVTPTPDLNLQPFVGMRIGVNGSRGFISEYRKAHVTAGRVTPIEDRIRR